MMQLLLIRTTNEAVNQYEGDIIGIFPMNHQFSQRELDIFDVVYVTEKKVEDFEYSIKTWLAMDNEEGLKEIKRKIYFYGELQWR
jgi:hypothetical protein